MSSTSSEFPSPESQAPSNAVLGASPSLHTWLETMLLRVRVFLRAHERAAVVVACTVAFVGLAVLFLRADPPLFMPNTSRSLELFTDPAAKSYEARNWALFGSFATSPHDNYNFWRFQSPVWVYPLALYYRLVGVGYPQLRLFTIGCTLTGLFAFFFLAAKRQRGLTFGLSAAFLSLNFFYLAGARSGLIEAWLNTFLIAAIAFLYLARRNVLWLLAAEWALVLAFLTKQTGLFLSPLLFLFGILAVRSAIRAKAPLSHVLAPFVQGTALLGALAYYVSRPFYYRTLAWNFGHVLFRREATEQVALEEIPVRTMVGRLLSGETWGTCYFSLFPVVGALAILEIGRVVVTLVRRRRVHPWDVLIAAWGVCSIATLLVTDMNSVHYRLVLFPPVVLLGANFLGRIRQFRIIRNHPRTRTILVGLLVSGELLTHAGYFIFWTRTRSYEIANAEARIRATAGNEGGVFVGMWAGPLTLGTKHKYYYLKSIFNTEDEVVSSFDVTHVLQHSPWDISANRFWASRLGRIRERKMLTEFDVRGLHCTLFEVKKGPAVHSAK